MHEVRIPARIRRRLRHSNEHAERNGDAIRKRMGEAKRAELIRRVWELTQSNGAARDRLRQLFALIDEWMSYNGENVACHRGCSNCCHMAVAILEPEAQLMAQNIGRPMTTPDVYERNFSEVPYGPSHPCPFLQNGECSIYEHRPFNCRTHYSLDIDAMLCELGENECYHAPLMHVPFFHLAYLNICAPRAGLGEVPRLADIRDFFPPANAGPASKPE